MVINTDTDHLQEVAHLLRRAGFGGTKNEIENLASSGYEAAVKKLMDRHRANKMADDKIWRYLLEHSAMMGSNNPAAYWVYVCYFVFVLSKKMRPTRFFWACRLEIHIRA